MKSFEQFLSEEISIKGNKGVPPEKISDIERRGARKIAGSNPNQLMGEIMGLLRRSQAFTRGKEKQLEKLAEEIIRDAFKGVVVGMDLNIKMAGSGDEVAEFIEKEDEEKKEEQEQEEQEQENSPKEEEEKLSPSQVKLAVDKRKIMNNIIQGEAKNTKHILHSDMSKEGLERIFGTKWREIFDIWDQMSKIADKLDWIIPIQHKADMMEQAPGGMAGACSTRFPKKKKEKTEEEEEAADEVLKSLEDGEDMMDKQEEIDKMVGIDKPTINSIGIDFPMLLHETVKGIYEMIADVAMPKGKKLATEVHRQTSSFADEAEDFRYGPYLAEDLTNFIAKNDKIDKYPNIKEFVFAKLIDSERWSDEECLTNLKNVFLESPSGRKLVDGLINETIEELDTFEKSLSDWKEKKKDYEDSQREVKREEEEELKDVPEWWKSDDEKSEKEEPKQVNYSDMSQREIQSLIDDALDSGDYEQVKNLSQYLKEGKEIYLKEIERINESHKFHTRLK